MATVQDHPARPTPAAKYDAAVEAQLARARQRIRTLDVTVAVLGFLAGTLAYGLVMTLCDRALGLSGTTRLLAFAGYALGAAVYLGGLVVRPLCRRINPYYAARQIERTVPNAKNSVVNWLDLHEQKLPPAIHGAVSHRAAKDLAQADLDRAVSGRRAAWLGGLTAGLFLVLFVVLVLVGPAQFFWLLGRVFTPFVSAGGIPARTRLTILRPDPPDVTVPVGRSVAFAVQVEGKVPDPRKTDALRLQFRYRATDPFETVPLELDSGREWVATVPASQVHNGFWYKITGGDAETAEYRVSVRSTPLVTRYEATYHYRPYLNWRDDTRPDPNLKDMRGTEVTLVARTNRPVREGRLELANAGKTIPGEPVEDDAQALRFRLVLEQDDQYRLFFTSTDGDANEPTAYTITVIPDYPPQVKLTKPAEDDGDLPINRLLRVEGTVSDDIGVKSLSLRLQVVDGPALQPKAYREGKSFLLSGGGYPKVLDYMDSVDLAKVKDTDGKDVALRPGMVLEFWLEASDACDYPSPHVAESKPRKRVKLTDPEMTEPQKQEAERRQAAEEQQQHEARQDEKIKQEDQQRQKDAPAKPQPNDQPRDPEQEKKDKELEKEAQRIKDALDKQKEQERKDRQPGESKGDDRQQGQAKDGGRPEPNGEAGRGEAKQPGQQDPQQKPAESKDGGGQQSDKTQAKGPGQSGSGGDAQGDAKAAPQPDARSEAKGAGKEGNAGSEPQGTPRDGGKTGPDDKTARGQQKSAPPEKGDGSDPARAEAKGSGQRSENAVQAGGQRPGRDAKKEDVERHAKDLRGGDAQKQQQAAEKLDDIRRNAGDAQAREAAGKELEKADQLPGKNATRDDIAQQAKDLQSGDARQRQEAAENLDRMSRNAKDEQVRDAARKELDKAEKRPGENARPADVDQQTKEVQSGDRKRQQQGAEKLDQMVRNANEQQVRDAARKELEKSGQKPGQDATAEDVAKQEKQLQQGSPEQKHDATDKLDQIRHNAKQEQVRDAARQAMEKNEKRPGESATPEEVAQHAKDLQNGDAKKQDQALEKLDQARRNAQNEQAREAARKALEQAQKQPGQGAQPDDVAQQAKDLQQDDARKQRDAADKLSQFLRNAKDEKTREAARKALEEAIQNAQKEQCPACAKQPGDGTNPPETAGPKKGPPPGQDAEAGTGKGSDQKSTDQGQTKNADPAQPPADTKDRGKTEHPLSPWMPGTGDGRSDLPVIPPDEPPGGPGDARHRERGGVLQLEDLKKIDKQLLDERGWSEEQLRSFQKEYADYLKRRQAEPPAAGEDKPLDPQRGGNLTNLKADRVKPIQGGPVDARSIGRGQAPPGYQDAAREFRRRIAELDTVPEKK